ncbi:7-cyano-7-deazaguanine synthase [Methanothermococcus sp. SCGC AD-155-C09]|nr:7-cyano-7-deazaguanine synthase [Methanothermococcus sp. SCGC AD-155-C09]
MHERIREIRIKSSFKNLDYLYANREIDSQLYHSLKYLLTLRSKDFEGFINYLSNSNAHNNGNNNEDEKRKAIVAFSGGIDSTVSVIISKKIFNILGITIQSPIIMNNKSKKNISSLADKLGISHKFIDVDLKDIEIDTLNGKYHPCGRCHSKIERAILDYAKENNINYIIYGDMLSTGYLSIIKEDENILRINMPSYLVLTKNENRLLALKTYNIKINQKYGCPLLKKAHKYNKNKKFTIQRILREVRAQVIDEEEGLENILQILF